MASKEEFFGTRPLRISPPIQLAGRKEPVFVRELTAAEDGELTNRRFAKRGTEAASHIDWTEEKSLWVVACLCDQDRRLLLSWEDLEKVKAMPASEIDRLWSEATDLNDEGGAVGAAKNSNASPT